ncbi:MAG TPA: hypothetical protein VFY79_10065 [Dehalococcoidia bacterium]|nr:hypothetical protein [Dehalococcoidia bacterium]
MLTRLDDYLVHQTPDTIDHVATGDRNFYDRYYFNAHTLDGDVVMVVAMGQYPNIGVIDAFVSVLVGGTKQYIVRASRALGAERMDTSAGPIGVEVLEGLRRMRVVVEPNEHQIELDMTFEGSISPIEEPRVFRRAGNRVVMDSIRLTQLGRWSGTLKVEGQTYNVEPSSWWGGRDHSWGIRSVGDREPASAPAPDAGPPGIFWMWGPAQFEEACLLYSCFEDGAGHRWFEGSELRYGDGDPRGSESLRIVRHDLTLVPGTRTFERGSVTLSRPDGRELTVRMEPKAAIYMAGAGYVYLTDGWRHGQYHAPLAVEGEVWDLGDPAVRQRAAGQTQTVCDFHVEGIEGLGTGHGIFELLLLGLYEPYGFRQWTDVAPAK